MKFSYSAMDATGRETDGHIEAESQSEAISKIRQKGLFPVRIQEVNGKPKDSTTAIQLPFKKKSSILDNFRIRIVTNSELSELTRKISTLIDAGLPLLRATRVILKQEKNPVLVDVLTNINDDIERGSTFSEALSKYPKVFNKMYVNMVKAGEAGGVLEITTSRLCDYIDKENEIKNSLFGSCIFTIAATIILTVMAAIATAKLPFGIFAIPAMLAVIITGGFKIGMMYGMISRNRNISIFTRTLATLLGSGVPILQALNITKDICPNINYKSATQMVHDSIKEGDNMSTPMGASGCFPSIVVNMVDVGEETGALPEMLSKISDIYDKKIDRDMRSIHLSTNFLMLLWVTILGILYFAKI